MGFFQRFFRPNAGKTGEADKAAQDVPPVPSEAPPPAQPVPAASDIPPGVTRPLPPEPTLAYDPQNGQMIFGQSTDQGMVRSNNQDAAYSLFFASNSDDKLPPFGLFIVADGMGGHSFGERAAAIATRIIAAEILKKTYLPLLLNAPHISLEALAIHDTLQNAFKKANDQIIKEVKDGGTTATAMIILGSMAYVAHVGDSRAYLVTTNGIEQITRDHSLVQRLIELNQLTSEEAKEHSQRNVLYRALGQSSELEIDIQTRRIQHASSILLCSDGLWGWVEEAAIQSTILNTPNPQEACQKLIDQANANGGHDNITAVLFKTPSN